MTHVHAPGHGPSPLPATVARVFAIIPAHDEAAILPGVLGAVRRQVQSDRILVVADNCTDDTADIARANGVGVHVTVDNAARKAGALNQGLSVLLPTLDDDDVLLVMDADTEIARGFVDAAVRALAEDPERGAVGGIFTGTDPRGFLEQAQANEYARYAREVERTRRVQVLSGTASVIRVRALREVGRARGTLLPGTPGEVYDATALTEDMEAHPGPQARWAGRSGSPAACRTSTQAHADRARAPGPAPAVVPRRHRQPAHLRLDAGDAPLCPSAGHARHRRTGHGALSHRHDRRRRPRPDRVPAVLGRRGRAVRPRAGRHRLARRVAWTGAGGPPRARGSSTTSCSRSRSSARSSPPCAVPRASGATTPRPRGGVYPPDPRAPPHVHPCHRPTSPERTPCTPLHPSPVSPRAPASPPVASPRCGRAVCRPCTSSSR